MIKALRKYWLLVVALGFPSTMFYFVGPEAQYGAIIYIIILVIALHHLEENSHD